MTVSDDGMYAYSVAVQKDDNAKLLGLDDNAATKLIHFVDHFPEGGISCALNYNYFTERENLYIIAKDYTFKAM